MVVSSTGYLRAPETPSLALKGNAKALDMQG
jgi:hypothetical protein